MLSSLLRLSDVAATGTFNIWVGDGLDIDSAGSILAMRGGSYSAFERAKLLVRSTFFTSIFLANSDSSGHSVESYGIILGESIGSWFKKGEKDCFCRARGLIAC